MRGRSILVALAVVAAVLLTPAAGYASGGSTWAVTVNNPSTHQIKITIYYGVGSLGGNSGWQYVNPGGTYLYRVPGAKCPLGVSGYIKDDAGAWKKLKDVSALGVYTGGDYWTVVCANIVFSVCQKSGQGYTEIRDGDWALCK